MRSLDFDDRSETTDDGGAFEPFAVKLSDATHGLLILCDHAENTLPPHYGDLGLGPEAFERHIAYDIGAKPLCEQLADRLDASLVMSRFSRLLIDPNRGLDDPTLIMRLSDGAMVPGNAKIDAAEHACRVESYYTPYDQAVADAIDTLTKRDGVPPILLSIHSFTPNWRGTVRPWHAGVLWDNDPRLAVPMIEALRADPALVVGDNEPYKGELPGDTMYRHGTRKGLAHALLEVRQDLIADDQGVEAWANRLEPIIQALLQLPDLRSVQYFGSKSDKGPSHG